MMREGVRKLAAVRKAVGDDFDIAVDAHGRCTTTMAVDFCTRVEELRPLWVEEPTQLEDLGELALLREKTKTPLATGERSSPSTASPISARATWWTIFSPTSAMPAASWS